MAVISTARERDVPRVVEVVVVGKVGPLFSLGGEHRATRIAQQPCRREGGIVDVLGVGHVVAVTVGVIEPPRGGDELHWPNRPVELGVAVEDAIVGVANERKTLDACG